jgi:hypothetical protein
VEKRPAWRRPWASWSVKLRVHGYFVRSGIALVGRENWPGHNWPDSTPWNCAHPKQSLSGGCVTLEACWCASCWSWWWPSSSSISCCTTRP